VALDGVERMNAQERREALDVVDAPKQFNVHRDNQNSGDVTFEVLGSTGDARLIEFDWRYDDRWGITRYEVRGAQVRPLYDAIWTPSILFVALFVSIAMTLALAATGRVLKSTWKTALLRRVKQRDKPD
jgi:hypothetical protein